MKWIKSKIIALALAVAGVLYFTNDFGLIDIEKTAIVVALGIDYEKESEDYSVTAQIAVPQGSNGAAIENNEISVCGNGKTIAEAIDAIGISSGWYPLLSFCRLVLVGEGLLSEDIVDTLNYFIRSDKVPDSALIAACEKEAKEILQSKTPLGKATSMAIETILVKDIAKTNAIAVINTKNFIQNYYSRSQSSFMPLIKLKKAREGEDKQGSEAASGISGGSGNTGAGDSSGNSESGGQKEEFVFDTDNTLLFSRGKKVATLDKEQTLLFNLLRKNSLETFLSLDEVKIGDISTNVLVDVENAATNEYITLSSSPVYTVKMDIQLKFEDVKAAVRVKDLSPIQQIPDEILLAAEQKIEGIIRSIFDISVSSDCDIFKLKENLYKYHYEEYEKYKDEILSSSSLSVKVKCYCAK